MYTHSEAAYGGSSGSKFRCHAGTDIVSQNEEANYTVVRFYGYMTKVATSSVYNLYATPCNIQPTGGQVNGNVNGYDGRYGSGPWYGITFDRGYYHDLYGNLTISHYFYHNGDNSPYLTDGATSHNLTLPAYYRYAALDGYSVSGITDTRFTLNLSSNRLADYIKVSINNGATYPYEFGGDWWDKSVTIGSSSDQLRSGTTYQVRIQVRRKASGLWTTSGTYNVTTLKQNNFFDLGEF